MDSVMNNIPVTGTITRLSGLRLLVLLMQEEDVTQSQFIKNDFLKDQRNAL